MYAGGEMFKWSGRKNKKDRDTKRKSQQEIEEAGIMKEKIKSCKAMFSP